MLSLSSVSSRVDESSTQPLSEHSDLRDFGSLLRRQLGIILLFGLLTAAVTTTISVLQPKQYQAVARVLYTDPGDTAGSIGGGDPERAIDTFTRLATTEVVLAPVAGQVGLGSTDDVRESVSVTASATANLLDVAAVAETSKGSAALANAVAIAMISWREDNRDAQLEARIASLEQQLNTFAGRTSSSEVAAASSVRSLLVEATAQLRAPNPELTLVSRAVPPDAPFAPRTVRNAIIGLIAGLMLGFAIGALRDRLDRKLRSPEDVEEMYPWPLLGVIPDVGGGRGHGSHLADFSSMSNLADAYRNIRTNVSLLSRHTGNQRVWVISSALPGEGKSAATANLAGALAATGLRVLAISADLHSPGLLNYYQASRGDELGLVDVLERNVRLEEAAVRVSVAGRSTGRIGVVDVVANDTVFPDPAVLFQSAEMADMLASARHRYDAIVIDAPPLLYTAEASLLARLADGLILVAGLKILSRQQAERANRMLGTMKLSPLGVIVTGLKVAEDDYGYRAAPKEPPTSPAEPVAAVRRA